MTESAEGVHVRRRAVLKLPFALAAASLLAGARALRAQDVGDGAFARFTERWLERAESLRAAELPADGAAEDPYAYEIAAMLAGLPPDAMPTRMRTVYDEGGLSTGPCFFEGPVFVIDLKLEPGAVIRTHNHPSLSVVTLGVEGACSYRHFEPLPGSPDHGAVGKTFRVRESRSGQLLPGRMSLLTRARDNIHGFRAGPKGARILDFSTTVAGNPNDFSYIEIESEAVEDRVHEAVWTGKD